MSSPLGAASLKRLGTTDVMADFYALVFIQALHSHVWLRGKLVRRAISLITLLQAVQA